MNQSNGLPDRKKIILKKFLFLILIIIAPKAYAWEGMATPMLHVEGRNLKDSHGNTVILHGFAQTYIHIGPIHPV